VSPAVPPPEPLLPAPLVVTGHLVTFDEARPEIPDGALYVDRSGLIVAVAAASDPPPPGFESANRVQTDAIVYPGLIDLHNHIAYNCLELWIAPDRKQPWTSRDQWPKDPDYLPTITLPVNALCAANGKAVLKYVECKAVVGGVTAIQGSSKVGRPFEGWMVRNIEYETFRTGVEKVNQSVFALQTEKDFAKAKRHLDDGNAFIYHLSEGTDPALQADFEAMDSHGCIAPRFVGIHCTALGDPQFAEWTPRGGSVVWSPFSNLWLYGATTDIAAARARGLRLCLGSDWSPSGTKNLLGELKVADMVNRASLGGLLSDQQLCEMVTCNPADAIGFDGRIGRLRAGLRADFVILDRYQDDVYRNLILALEADVRLVAINGYPMYGEAALMQAAAAVDPGPIDVGGLDRVISMRDARIEDADMSWPEVLAALEHVRSDAVAAQAAAIARAGGPDAHLKMIPDKPWDNPAEGGPAVDLAGAQIGPLDSLVHDDAYFAAIDRAVIHGGRLSGLRGYWSR
jgi:5-methylthioadenosine/S-adenosylhomocysteine deaminase